MKVIKRDSNFELLRIVSMLFIILHHFVLYNNYKVGQVFSLFDFILTSFISGGKLGVVLFTLITGYYMIKSKDIKLNKLVGLEAQVLFYSLGILLLFMLSGSRVVRIEEFSKLVLPNISKTYWFFSSYFILYLFIPFLNRLVSNISKKEYEKLLLIGFIFLILVPSLVIYNRGITEGVYLVYYYLVGGYIRCYCDDIKGGIKYLFVFLFFYLAIVFFTAYVGKLSSSNQVLLGSIDAFTRISSILVFVSSISLFLFFKGLKLGSNKIINLIASTSFGVYLFHEHMFMREFLWNNVFSFDKVLVGNGIFIKGIFIAILVYLVGSLVDLFRRVIFKYFNKMIEKVGWNKLFN